MIPQVKVPCVIDADGLNFLSQHNVALPPQTILTPHRGEMARLLKLKKIEGVDNDFLKTCQQFAEEKNVTLVLKGAPLSFSIPKSLFA